MGLSYHFSFAAPALTPASTLEAFLKSVETDSKRWGFHPTLVINATFDTPQRKEFVRRLTTGLPVEDKRLQGVALPEHGTVWGHNQHLGTARVIPAQGVFLVVTDRQQCETIFGFFRYPDDIPDIHGKTIAQTGLKQRWVFRNFVDSPDPRFRDIVRRFADAGFVESVKDEYA